MACPHGVTASEPPRSESAEGRHPRWTSRDLFGGRREIVIVHAGQEYRLRITRADKLILTK
jgi:hemin uptake protein HemP